MATELVEWQENYSLGLEHIDKQHRSLFELINKIWHAIVGRSDKADVFKLVDELEHYTLAHFAAEESFMDLTGYPDLTEHKREHEKFVTRVAEEKGRALQVGALSLDLVHFLSDWLINHILVSDKAYARFSKQSAKRDDSLMGRLFKRFF